MNPGRREHYAAFYGDAPREAVAVVWGNCQAEAVRVLLAGSATFPYRTVRVPPVHELTAADMAHLDALLPHVAMLAAQPVRVGYRGLPIGTPDVAARLAPGATVVRWPVVRWCGFHPYQAIVRHPADPSLEPPVVPYHDLRTIAAAAGRARRPVELGPVLRQVAEDSIDELEQRERAGTDVSVAGVLTAAGARAVHTINHPGNAVLIELARRIQRAVDAPPDADDPGRDLLGRIRAPLEPDVLAALGDTTTPARPAWSVDGADVAPDDVRDAHLAWYRDNPDCVEEGLRRYSGRMALLGL